MGVREKIESWLDTGIESREAVGLRGTNVQRMVGTALFGVQPQNYVIIETPGKPSHECPRVPAVAFHPYLDRTYHKGIQQLRSKLSEWREDPEKYGTHYSINHNLESYALDHARACSPEMGMLEGGRDLFSDCIMTSESIHTPSDMTESLYRETGLDSKKLHLLAQLIAERKGIQYTFSSDIFRDFHVAYDQEDEALIHGFNGWLPGDYVSGIKVRTDLELSELRSFADRCDHFLSNDSLVLRSFDFLFTVHVR